MSYPALPILRSSSATREAGIDSVRMTNGMLRTRQRYSANKTTFRVEHILSGAERATLEAAFASYATANLTFTWPADGVAYTVRFAGAPQYEARGPWWMARVQLEEV